MTLHRPSNVDCPEVLERLVCALEGIAKHVPLVFPCPPRTILQLHALRPHWDIEDNKQETHISGILLLEPLGYLDFLKLMSEAKVVLIDSGGIQEEATILSVPCITLREHTKRPATGTHGTNVVVGSKRDRIVEETVKALKGAEPNPEIPEPWDGKASERITRILLDYLIGTHSSP